MPLFRPSPTELPRPHERVFLERYADILTWALKLTRGDKALAHDLAHDAFIQFTLSRPDLDAIQNLDSYLYGTLRNLHISHLRRASRDALQTLALAEFDSIYRVLAADRNTPDTPLDVQNELRQICAFACQRKETSKSASILILRFFYDYLPKEIGDIALVNISAVYNLLLTARREVSRAKRSNWKASVDRPRTQKANGCPDVRVRLHGRPVPVDTLLAELRDMLLAARCVPCPPPEEVLALYREPSPAPIECSLLAHLVSCQPCLDLLNDFMKRPRIDQRVPGESMDSDQTPEHSEMPRDQAPTLPVIGRSRFLKAQREELYAAGLRRREEIYQHWPTGLSIAVNGELQASQMIQGKASELKAHLDRSVRAEFVEVFSEQGLRLLLASVADAPPEGPHERHLAMDLSDGRQLEMVLEFGSQGLSITVRYEDPGFATLEAGAVEGKERRDAMVAMPRRFDAQVGRGRSLWERLARLMPSTGWAIATALGVLAIVGIFFYSHHRSNPLDARGLLSRAVVSEAQSVDFGRAEHRTFRIEKLEGNGVVTPAGHADVWHGGGKLARRFYDNQDHLVAGDWTDLEHFWSYSKADGLNAQRSATLDAAPTPARMWQTEPTAGAFARIADAAASFQAMENSSDYRLEASLGAQPGSEPHLVRAALVMTRNSLHAQSETLWFSDGATYRLLETSYDQPKMSEISPETFRPDSSLRQPADSPRPRRRFPEESSLIHLELQVLMALHGIGADVGDPITVTRESSREGRIVHVFGILDTSARQEEVIGALTPLLSNPSLKIGLNTPKESGARSQKRRQPAPASVRVFDATGATIPAYDDLREYFARQGYKNQELENHIQAFCFAVLQQSSAGAQQAWAMKRLVDDFAPDELTRLDNESRVLWLRMLESHAREFNRNVIQLQTSLALIYPDQAVAKKDTVLTAQSLKPGTLPGLITAAQTLFNQSLQNDATLRSAFSHTNSPDKAAALKTTEFHIALAHTERTAAAVFAVTGKLENWASLNRDSKK